ncbi:VOC family protein [bacterium]|nr:VOC family protein [bacterium]
MKKNAVNWFEIYVEDFERAKKFYETILDAPMMETEDVGGMKIGIFPFDKDHGGVGGSIVCSPTMKASPNGTVAYLNAEGNLDGIIARVEKSGGKIVMPRTGIPPNGFIALISDPEGNTVGLHSYK